MIIYKYETEEEMQQIITEELAKGFRLTEIANITEGNYIAFTNEPIPPVSDPIEQQISDIKNTVEILLLKQEGIL